MNIAIKNISRLPLLLCLLLCFFYDSADAQWRKKKPEEKKINPYEVDSLLKPIPMQRQRFHERINEEQKKADATDGVVNNKINYSDDSAFTKILTRSILRDVDRMQVLVENMPNTGAEENQTRIRYLTALWDMLRKFNADTKVDPYLYKKLVANMRELLVAVNENKFMEFAAANINIYTLENGKDFYNEHKDVQAFIYIEMGKQSPKMMIKRLSEYANQSFACDIIAEAAKVTPDEIYNFASSTNFTIRNAIRNCKDRLVQTIAEIADKSRSPLKAMPFLSDIYNKRKTLAQIDSITANHDQFFLNLVRLKVQNDSMGSNTYSDELAYRGLKYVREMNDLHEEKDTVRFKCIESFAPEALYFIMVNGQDEIYTSSFVGTFRRFTQRMHTSGDTFLARVHYDHFRTFIRMCAGYNTLTDFLNTMSPQKKTRLMTDFIAGLGNGKEDDLEDAVDVADAFGSIKDSVLSVFLRDQVKKNYEQSYRDGSKKGLIVYSLLAMLFDGTKAGNNEAAARRQSERLGLPPVFMVPYKNLLGDTTVVVEQFFFFGDKDGKTSYSSFLGNFRDKKWKINEEKYWTTITSTIGKPILIYANQPLAEPDDEVAQNALFKYLTDHHIRPTVMVHRGHSYHLPITMDRLSKQNKIIILGSCGGYHNLSVVLDHAPDAQIISSKQTGTMSVNEPIIKAINDYLLEEKDINWINIWKELEEYFINKPDVQEKFNDYVPPYKNLGAMFIKAYRRMANED